MEINRPNENKGIRIFICDDLESERQNLSQLSYAFFNGRGQSISISFFDSGEAMLAAISEQGTPDLIFQDIYMGGMTGVETARKLREISAETDIIFTTTSREHGADAFEVEAFHYLVKPIDGAKFEKVMSKWLDGYCDAMTVTVKTGRSEKKVAVSDIMYIDINKRMCAIHTTNETIDTPPPLSTLEELLPKGQFFKPIRYCIVAYRHVLRVDDEGIVMKNNAVIPISRLKRDEVKEQVAAYRLRMLRGR